MDGTRKYHPELYNTESKGLNAIYTLISRYQPKEDIISRKKPPGFKKANKLKNSSEDASIPLGQEKKVVPGQREQGRKAPV